MTGLPQERARILFLHIGWARRYRGEPDDPALGSFGYIRAGATDTGEVLNFKPYRGRCYGYAPVRALDLKRLGGVTGAASLDGVLVVWTATDPDGTGRYVVGWYRDARVYAKPVHDRPDPTRPDILAVAAAADVHLIPVDARTFFIPARERGWPGVASAFYAGANLSAAQIDRLLAYVGGEPSAGFAPDALPPASGVGGPRNTDPDERTRVWKAAVACATRHYEGLGWRVENVETQNLGWDLTVHLGTKVLRVEVKGRKDRGAVEISVNEFRAMNNVKLRLSCRLAIVFEALSESPTLTIFAYAPGRKVWLSEEGEVLTLEERVAALARF